MLYLLKTLFVIDVLVATGLLLFRHALAPRYRGVVTGKLVAVALLTPAVALFCGNINLFYLYLAAVIAFNSRSQNELAGALVFMLPSVPLLGTSMVVGGVYLLDASTVIAMGLGALIGFLVTRGRKLPGRARYDTAMWVLVGIFTFIYNHNPEFTDLLREVTVNLLTVAGPYLLVSRAARTVEDLGRTWLRLLMGATVMALTAVFQAARNWVIFETYYQSLHVPIPLTSAALSLRGGHLRTGGSMLDYSAGGLFLAAMLTMMLLLRRQFTRQGFWLVLAVLTGGLLASQSRGAWVGALAGLIFVAAYCGRWNRAMALAGGAAAVFLLVRAGPLARLGAQTQEAAFTVEYRQRLASRGLDAIRAHPLFGQSPKQLVASLSDLTQGQHIVDLVNGHLSIAMTAGLPLFVIWCAVWLMPIAELWRQRRGTVPLAGAPAAILVPAMVALTFTSFIDRNLAWPVVALGLTLPGLTLGRVGADRRRAPPGTDAVDRPGVSRQAGDAAPSTRLMTAR